MEEFPLLIFDSMEWPEVESILQESMEDVMGEDLTSLLNSLSPPHSLDEGEENFEEALLDFLLPDDNSAEDVLQAATAENVHLACNSSRKRQRESSDDREQVKKPRNAAMPEQRTEDPADVTYEGAAAEDSFPAHMSQEEPLMTPGGSDVCVGPAVTSNHDSAQSVQQAAAPEYHQLARNPGRKRRRETSDDRDYVKRPPNAFMLYMKEQRPQVPADISKDGGAAVNTFLARQWRLLTWDQQAPYYEQASVARSLHYQQHPDWTCKENYGKKRRTRRKKVAPQSSVSTPHASCHHPPLMEMEVQHPDAPQQTRPLRLRRMDGFQVLPSQGGAVDNCVLVQLPGMPDVLSAPVCELCKKPHVYLVDTEHLLM